MPQQSACAASCCCRRNSWLRQALGQRLPAYCCRATLPFWQQRPKQMQQRLQVLSCLSCLQLSLSSQTSFPSRWVVQTHAGRALVWTADLCLEAAVLLEVSNAWPAISEVLCLFLPAERSLPVPDSKACPSWRQCDDLIMQCSLEQIYGSSALQAHAAAGSKAIQPFLECCGDMMACMTVPWKFETDLVLCAVGRQGSAGPSSGAHQ